MSAEDEDGEGVIMLIRYGAACTAATAKRKGSRVMVRAGTGAICRCVCFCVKTHATPQPAVDTDVRVCRFGCMLHKIAHRYDGS